MQYKVLALDLDGTLTNTEKVITPRTKAALQEAARRGVCICLLYTSCASIKLSIEVSFSRTSTSHVE